MENMLSEFSTLLIEYINNEVELEKLQECTLNIIADDDFEKLPDEIQDAIYTVDSDDLNHLTDDQLHEVYWVCKSYITSQENS